MTRVPSPHPKSLALYPKFHTLPARFLALLVCVASLSSVACQSVTSSCSRDEEFVEVKLAKDGGSGISMGNTYYSAPYGGPYVYFPPAKTISFVHGLGLTGTGEPAYFPDPKFFLAFSEGGILAPSAGNMTELVVSDKDPLREPALSETRISVHNNTCSDFYLWVTATRPVYDSEPGGSAGASGAASNGGASGDGPIGDAGATGTN